jgi:putative hydrolase of the HAD superfamily
MAGFQIRMAGEGDVVFDAVAFDLDGTLYPNISFYRLLLPFLSKNMRLLRAFGGARAVLRRPAAASADFYTEQAEITAKLLRADAAETKKRIEEAIYLGWEPLFKKVRLYPYVKESLGALKGAGLKLALLSDFPLGKKLEHLGLEGFWDAAFSSEETGRLKPDPLPFTILARRLGVRRERILYVGNSARYDAAGARAAGMKTALIRIAPRLFQKKIYNNVDFFFHDYRKLSEYILQ